MAGAILDQIGHHLGRGDAAGGQPMLAGAPAGLSLRRGRVHEICGPARVALAAMVMGQGAGPVLWILPAWQGERLCPDGLAAFANPARLILAQARRVEDMLWALEEGLRSGAVPLAVAELPEAPGLTPVRRLHLAAEAGAAMAEGRGLPAPLGLMLTPGMGGAAGVESRWRMEARPSGSSLLEERQAWRLERLRARGEGPATFDLARRGRVISAVAAAGA